MTCLGIPIALVVTSFVLLSLVISPNTDLYVFFRLYLQPYQLSCHAELFYIYVVNQLPTSSKNHHLNLYSQWQNKKCFSDSECQTWGTGNFCCGDTCCDELPEEDEEGYEEYYYDYLDEEYIDEPWIDLDYKSSEDEVGEMDLAN